MVTPTIRTASQSVSGLRNTRGDHERILAVKIFMSAILVFSLLGIGAVNAGDSPAMHPHSFDYYDENGVEHTGINLNLRSLRHDGSQREEHSGEVRHHRSRDHRESVLLLVLDPDRD